MTRDQIEEIMRENGIVVVGEAVYRLVNLVQAKEREDCVDVLLRLHERAAGRHNYYQYAANVLLGDTSQERVDEMQKQRHDTTPPQRTWVGLTDEDKQIAFDDTQEGGGFWEFADAIEAKLKEKNT